MFGKGKLGAEIARLETALLNETEWGRDMLTTKNSDINELKAKIDTRNAEIAKLKKQLRKQNSADILVNAFVAVGIIPTEEKKDHHAEQNRLMALQQQYCRDMSNAQYDQYFNNNKGD